MHYEFKIVISFYENTSSFLDFPLSAPPVSGRLPDGRKEEDGNPVPADQ